MRPHINAPSFKIMNPITNKTRKAEEISQQIANLVKTLKGWNLISGLFYAGEEPEDVVIYALAKEARDITMRLLELTHKLGEAAIRGDIEAYKRLKVTLAPLYKREAVISSTCQEKLKQSSVQHSNRKETAA